jgi:hypothetical protein
MITYEQYLRDSAVAKEVLDVYLDPNERTWAQFDPELGYTLGNSLPRDGLDGCSTISTAQENGRERLIIMQIVRVGLIRMGIVLRNVIR